MILHQLAEQCLSVAKKQQKVCLADAYEGQMKRFHLYRLVKKEIFIIFLCSQPRKVKMCTEPQHEMQEGGHDADS
jgi:hypothetical protein